MRKESVFNEWILNKFWREEVYFKDMFLSLGTPQNNGEKAEDEFTNRDEGSHFDG